MSLHPRRGAVTAAATLPAVRALITGATGFAGPHLIDHCLEAGDELHALVYPGTALERPDAVVAHLGDVTDGAGVAALLRRLKPEVIYHLAGYSSVGRSFADPIGTWDLNLSGSLAVLDALRVAADGARALVITSSEVYGRVPADELPARESTPFRPASPYGASKAAVDLATAQYRENYGVMAIRVRAFNHIGPGQDDRFVLPNVAGQIARAEAEGHEHVEVRVGNVDTRRDFTDVRDIVRAYRVIATEGDPARAYLPCSGRSVAVRELLEGLAPHARLSVSLTSDSGLRREGEQADLYGDPGPLRDELGWAPEYDLDHTLADTLTDSRRRMSEGPS